MELIGKQIAIETILGQPPELHYPSWYARQIEDLPPAPPEYLAEQAGILVTDSDTISRAKAIDALRGYLVGKRCPDDGTLTCRLIENEVINKLPSAQPEIVRCKDCKYAEYIDDVQSLWCTECGNGRTVAPYDFCSYGEVRAV